MQLNIEDSVIALTALQLVTETAICTLEAALKKILLLEEVVIGKPNFTEGLINNIDKLEVTNSLDSIPTCLGVCHKLLLNLGDSDLVKRLKEKDAYLREEFYNHAKIASEIGLRTDGLDEQVSNAR